MTDDHQAATVAVVRNEVDPDSEFHCDALAARVDAADGVANDVDDGGAIDAADDGAIDAADDGAIDAADDGAIDADEVEFAAGERVDLEAADGVVLTGSTAGVYEDHAWIDEQETLVRELVDRELPTLGVCFGHQVVNEALGGTVEHVGTTAGLVEAELDDDPLFEAVEPVVPALHGDVVTEPGDDLDVIATAPHAAVFGTRHRSAPLWTVQFHPELTAAHRERLLADYDWAADPHTFEDVTAERVLENFAAVVAEAAAARDER